MTGKNKTEKRIEGERIRRAFRAGERHARAIGALTEASALADEAAEGALLAADEKGARTGVPPEYGAARACR